MTTTGSRALLGLALRQSSQNHIRRCMSANARVWIDKDTRVICQGFTGKQVSEISSRSLVLEPGTSAVLCNPCWKFVLLCTDCTGVYVSAKATKH